MNDKNIIKFSKCCAHLYGAVTLKDIKDTIYHYNHEDVDETTIKEVLEKFISKRTTIQLYNNFVYKAKIIDTPTTIELLYNKASSHEFYYPDRKPEFYAFESSTYADITYPHFKNLFNFIEQHIMKGDTYWIADDITMEIASIFMSGYGPDHVMDILFTEYKKILSITENEINKLLDILINAHNNTRQYDLRGFTPIEVQNNVKSKPYLY